MKKYLVSFAIVLFSCSLFSQETKEEFQPSGDPFVKIFTNFNSSIIANDVHNSFEIQRVYFGYKYKLSKTFTGVASIDVGDPGIGSFQMTAYLKNAYVEYKNERFTTKFGLIGLSQFSLQEKQWGGRHLYKSFQDQHKFGSSADLGCYVSYKIHKIASVDVTVSNGEGYKTLEKDSLLKYSGGLTLDPIKGLTIRAYYDYMGEKEAQQTVALFAGYSLGKMKIGAEYNQQINNKMTADKDFSGMSFYGSYEIKKIRVFGRFDQLTSVKIDNATNPWNQSKDGQAIIGGFEISPVKGVKIAPNYQLWMPANKGPVINIVYLSCEINF